MVLMVWLDKAFGEAEAGFLALGAAIYCCARDYNSVMYTNT